MSKQIVTSQYFRKPVMDESLTDFQEKQKINTGPKTDQKPKVNGKKAKPRRRIKGQKDIRTLIKSKKNELLTFTKDFNDVCVKSGIDIDSQQLQLAIALSKSLQQPGEQAEAECSQSKALTSQERTNRIRRTLQEYGFKVPESKITEANRRVQRCRKPCKLLLISEEEKRQGIIDRYSQVLFQNPNNFFESYNNKNNFISKGLYYLATNITYELMRKNEIFYIPGVLQDTAFKKSNLLKDWSEIPGRPASPKQTDDFVVSISEIQCTQTELDTILSGTIKTTKDIFKLKIDHSSLLSIKFQGEKEKKRNYSKNSALNLECASNAAIEIEEFKNSVLNDKKIIKDLKIGQIDNLCCRTSTMLSLPQQTRCLSPDIFDDEASSLIDSSNVYSDKCLKSTSVSETTIEITHLSDLLQPVEVIGNSDICKQCSQLSQITNRTKRRTNDFMDLTECAHTSLRRNNTISLSQTTVGTNKIGPIEYDCMEITECVNPVAQSSNVIDGNTIDLTQNVESHQDVEISKISKLPNENATTLDLTQSSNSDEDLPIIDICGTHKNSSDETASFHYDNYSNAVSDSVNIIDISHTVSAPLECNELTQDLADHENVIIIEENIDKSILCTSKYPAYIITDDISEDSPNTLYNSQNKMALKDNFLDNNEDVHDNSNIDLTQSSNSSVEVSQRNYYNAHDRSENQQFNDEFKNLGKKDNISIDYDEICSGVARDENCLDQQFDDIQARNAPNFSDNETELSKTRMGNSQGDLTNCKNVSESFELSDQEFHYSLCKSKVENFDVGGISIMDNISKVDKSKNNSLSESYLPTVSVKNNTNDQTTGTCLKLKSISSTPIKAIIKNDKILVQTPTNSEYIIKLEQITPMLDYAAMSSPERNEELAKYGLKPFKRKRAIQLLTHLYNQTHPIIECCSEEPEPPKKLKLDSPKKVLNSPKKKKITKKIRELPSNPKFDKENNIYEETKDTPDIRDIECSADDWVFQKREKAKVHSCRVPLHIAFHNYVTCRRGLQEAILRYEPVNIDVIHKDLVSYGYRYNPKDLLKFFDKKCITVKTADNNARNGKK